MSRDHRATKRADLILLVFVVVLVVGLALGVLEAVRPALELELDDRKADVLGDQVEREPTAP